MGMEPTTRLFTFAGGSDGQFEIERQTVVVGEALPVSLRLACVQGSGEEITHPDWILRGTTSNGRYTTRAEHDQMTAVQAPMGRPEATLGALIPIRKSPAWWALTQDERRAIFEDQSRHIGASMRYLPAIARRLHHSRDLREPFDFLTWFDFAPEHEAAFDELVAVLRGTEEWKYVDREIDIRVRRVV